MLYLFLFLKLPIAALAWLVWWAVHQTDEPETGPSDGGSGPPRHPHPPLPRLPRRGPHAEAAPPSPPRVRHGRTSLRSPERLP